MNFKINMLSMTQAQRAMSFLRGKGISCVVERSHERGKGCSFALRVTNADRTEVCGLLRQIGVRCDLP